MVSTAPLRPTHQCAETSGALLSWSSALVERFTRFETHDLVKAQSHLNGVHHCITLAVDGAENFVNYREVFLSLGDLILTIGCINARQGYELGFRSGDEYLVTIPLRGSGWASNGDIFVEYGEGDILIVAPSCPVVKHWDGPGEVVSLHVPAERFDSALSRLGVGPIEIAPFLAIENGRLRTFLRVIDMICRDLLDDSGMSPFHSNHVASQLEDILLTLLLEKLSGGDASLAHVTGGSPAIPYYVRRAEDFIAANAHRNIGIEEIADSAGVSLRSIQYGFRHYRDTTPMLYLKRLRYMHARRMLTSAEGGRRKIADIAAEIGCSNVSQFSRDYRAMFGETPSDTVAAPRRLLS